MKTIAKLLALCLMLGVLGFAQGTDAGDKKGDDAKKSDTATKTKGKKSKSKSKKKDKKSGEEKPADDKK
jgi:hypothetical protein